MMHICFTRYLNTKKNKLENRDRKTKFAKQNLMLHKTVIILSHQLPHSILGLYERSMDLSFCKKNTS